MLKIIKALTLTSALAISSLFVGGVASAQEEPIQTCEITIIKGQHTWENRAQATGVCKGYVEGYYISAFGEEQFSLTGLAANLIQYDGQQFELATPKYSRIILTAHIVKQSTNGWKIEAGKWVYYNPSTGKKHTGWLYDKAWYYLDSNGYMKTGWQRVNGLWYYLTSSGAMKTGWVLDRSTWYYLASSGEMKTGWILDKSKWYYLASSGAMKTGWQLINGKWYYLYSDGKMAVNTKIGNYYIDRNGAWVR